MSITLAAAPVSYGVFELSPDDDVELPGPDELLRLVAESGCLGIDSGPIGMFGRSSSLRQGLTQHGLALAGGWIDLPFSDSEQFAAAMPGYRDALVFFAEAAAVAEDLGRPPPRPTLACSGSDERRANPGRGLSLTAAQLDRFAENVDIAQQMAQVSGLQATFHHHACTFIERPEEIDALLSRTSIGLTLDTGHLLLGGGDPLEGLRRWQDRIDHVHLKDARREVLDRVIAERAGMREVWSRRAFVALGEGDLDVPGVMDHLMEHYSGWLVIEQDVLPSREDDPQRAQRDQLRNREVLRRWLP